MTNFNSDKDKDDTDGKKLLLGEPKKSEDDIEENTLLKGAQTPPNVIMLRRVAIRMFPTGQKVAMYYADAIKKYISIPYEEIDNPSLHNDPRNPMIGISEAAKPRAKTKDVKKAKKPKQNHMDVLKHIAWGQTNSVLHFEKIGDKPHRVDRQTAAKIIQLHTMLSKENQEKMKAMVGHSKKNFDKVVKFANEKVGQTGTLKG